MMMAGIVRGGLRPNHPAKHSYIIVGLIVIIIVLGINYWSTSVKHSRLQADVDKLKKNYKVLYLESLIKRPDSRAGNRLCLQCRQLAIKITRSLYLRRRTNFKAQNRKTKTDTNPIPDPNRYRRRCPDPIARIQKFYTFIGTPEKSVH